MIVFSDVVTNLNSDLNSAIETAKRIIGIPDTDISESFVLKTSIDARHRKEPKLVSSVAFVTNKDEKNQLTEGIIKVGSKTKIEKTFNLKDDLVEFGKQMDLAQRKLLTPEEAESTLVAATPILKDINFILKDKPVNLKEFPENLITIHEKLLDHRENSRKPEKFLKLCEKTTQEEYIEALKKTISHIETALKKNITNISLPVYSLVNPKKELSVFIIDPKNLIKEGLSS